MNRRMIGSSVRAALSYAVAGFAIMFLIHGFEGAPWQGWVEPFGESLFVVATSVLIFAISYRNMQACRRWQEALEREKRKTLEMRLQAIAERLSETERRALIDAKETAEASNRARSSFFAHMSHELRTPLNGIIGYSEALQAGIFGPLAPRHRAHVKSIWDAGLHLQSLINDLLDLARLDAGRTELREEFRSLADLVDCTVAEVAPLAAKKHLRLDVANGAAVPEVLVDAVRVRQILENLLGNAIKFTPDGGRITVGCERPAQGQGVAVTVRDTGIGMRPVDVPNLLKPFERAPGVAHEEGTGLGLPMVAELVKLHGARLDIETAPDAGTTVRVWFPENRVRAASSAA